jgi:hypothetical protein
LAGVDESKIKPVIARHEVPKQSMFFSYAVNATIPGFAIIE